MVRSNIEMGRHRDLSKRKKTTHSSPAAPPSTTTITQLGALPLPPPPPAPPSQPPSDPRPSAPSDTQSRASRLPTSSHTPSREQSTTRTSEAAPTIGSETSKRRLPVYLCGKFLEPSGTCSRLIRGIIEEKIDFEGYNWKDVSKETKDFYFEEFRVRQLGRKPIAPELHLYTHTKNHDGKTFTNAKSKKSHDTFTSKMDELTQANETIDENKLYLDVVGGENRNGVYGLGSQACEYYGTRPPTSFQSGQQNSEEINELRQRIIQQDEDIKNLKDLTERLLQRIDGMSGTQPPPQHAGDDEEDDDDDESATV